MRVAFRVDASLQMGTGHVMRCLTLADALAANGGQSIFICRAHGGHLANLIQKRGYQAYVLSSDHVTALDPSIAEPEDSLAHAGWLGVDWLTDAVQTRRLLESGAKVDWLVVDHYALDVRWEHALRHSCHRLLVIDDLADRAHDCDLLLDQNLGRNLDDYVKLLPPHCTVLVGPKYALLRPEFARLRAKSLARRASPQLAHFLISLGGVDKDNATGAVLAALPHVGLPAECRITVVMGSQAPSLKSVRQQVKTMPWKAELLIDVQDMATLMVDCDLAIGAAGSSSWERCCLGVPTVLVMLADNQRSGAQALQAAGCAVLLGEAVDIPFRLEACVRRAAGSMVELTQRSSRISAGDGAERVVNRIKAQYVA